MKKLLFAFLLQSTALLPYAQDALNFYPTNWWVGMKNPALQLLIHAPGVSLEKVTIRYPGIQVQKISTVENPNYLFVDLRILPGTKPGRMNIQIGGKNYSYELNARNRGNGQTRVQGVTSADLIYLLMPDRFSNGEPANDVVASYRDQAMNREDPSLRHGGDLAGIKNHLDYFSELGVTALWLTPVWENDMPLEQEGPFKKAGYHGYWFTDHYLVDKRLGGNEAYLGLVEAAHAKGLKIVQDAVYNHVGMYHWFVQDLPSKDWLNQWPQYTAPNHREESIFDPQGSATDKENMLGGWFVPHLPDLNLRNPFLARFLIQHAIWTTEYFGIDGWRVDTYKYCDEAFLNSVNEALYREFPRITVFGEAWANSVVGSAYFAQNNMNPAFRHNSQGVTDFPLAFAMIDGMNQPFGWTQGVNRIYMTLAEDLLYKDPLRNCIFLDNHDMDRVYSVTGENWNKLKMGINWLFTLKGIPQLYYGTEILMKNFKNPSEAEVRRDFPGGWAGDPVDKFQVSGRTEKENTAFEYIRRLAKFRQQATAIINGKLMQYVPQNGFYVYFRYNEQQTIAVASNTGNQETSLADNRYTGRTRGFHHLRNVVTGAVYSLEDFRLAPGDSQVLELLP